MTPEARRELAKAFIRILRAREPGLVWTLTPDDAQPVLGRAPLPEPGAGATTTRSRTVPSRWRRSRRSSPGQTAARSRIPSSGVARFASASCVLASSTRLLAASEPLHVRLFADRGDHSSSR